MADLRHDMSLSLKEKFSKHWDDKKQKIGIPHVHTLNRWAPIMFFVIFLGASAWGTLVVLPANYEDYFTFVVYEVFTVYVFCQILINWLLLKFTHSTYDPAVHGTEHQQPRPQSEPRHIGLDADGLFENGAQLGRLSMEGTAERNDSDIASTNPDSHAYQVFIPVSVSDTNVERKAYSYWSWKPCIVCQQARPPRCHHCTLCNSCVLKRDHHCFFARNCVGPNNQRYFLFFLVWCVIMTSWGTYQITPYVFREILPKYSYLDFVFPISLFRSLFGYFPLLYFHLTFVNLGTMGLLAMSLLMLSVNLRFLIAGKTSFEIDENIKIIDTRNIPGRLRAVLGEDWALSLFLPGYAKTKPKEDAVYWPDIKVS